MPSGGYEGGRAGGVCGMPRLSGRARARDAVRRDEPRAGRSPPTHLRDLSLTPKAGNDPQMTGMQRVTGEFRRKSIAS